MSSIALYELTDSIKELDFLLEEEEIDKETYNDTLELVNFELQQKSNNIVYFINGMQNKIDFLSSEIKRLQSLKKQREKKLERLKEYIRYNLSRAGIKKVEFDTGSFSLRNSTSVNIKSGKDIPVRYKTLEYVEKIDKNLIKTDIKAGIDVSGASLITKENLIIK